MKTLFLLASMAAFSLTPAPGFPQSVPGPQDQNSPAQADQVKVFVGELSKVDATVKAIFVKGTEPNREMIFFYDDQTEVIGADEGVRGLTGNTGAQLKISYRDERGLNLATKIEIQPKKV